MITNEKINSNHFHLPDAPKDESLAKYVAEDENIRANDASKQGVGELGSHEVGSNGLGSSDGHERSASNAEAEYSQPSNGAMHAPENIQANLFAMQEANNAANECKTTLFSNFNPDSNDKIWSLLDNNEEFSQQEYATAASMIKKSPTAGNESNFNVPPPASSYTNFARSPQCQMGGMMAGPGQSNTNRNAPLGVNNWSMNSPTPASIPSNLTWSNNFNSAQPSVPSFSSMSNNMAWQNGFGGTTSFANSKRSPMANMKKQMYNPNDGQVSYANNQIMAPKYRQGNAPNLKNFANNQIYDMGSTGSDNTSSSSDSANVLFQNRNLDANCGPLETLRYSLEPQLLEMVRQNNMSHENNKSATMNYPFQTIEDKKQMKNRNFGRKRGKSPFFTGQHPEGADHFFVDANSTNPESNERFSRKVFVGGLPPDIDEEEITASFRRFGPLVVDWPHKAESKSYFPPKGYAFLLFQDETSVQMLIEACMSEDDKLYLCVSSPTIKDKAVQIRPWRLTDADYVLDASLPLDPRKTVFVGGVPRPLKAVELAMIMDRLYGGVCYAGIDTDPELKYPKGAGRVAFSSQQSYIAAISARFVQLQHADIEKRVEVKPYVLDDQNCDECQGARCGGKFAPFFCANIHCLQYYCENCWATIHSRPGREFHKPLVKEGADRPRAVPFRWC